MAFVAECESVHDVVDHLWCGRRGEGKNRHVGESFAQLTDFKV